MILGAARVFIVTAYSFGCGATGDTAYTHRPPTPFYTAAVDRNVIKGGSLLELDAPFVRGHRWYAEDTGSAKVGGKIVGDRIDIMVATCQQARWWGVRRVPVRVVGHVPRKSNGLGK